jgi:hypothetical protein
MKILKARNVTARIFFMGRKKRYKNHPIDTLSIKYCNEISRKKKE